jgi:fructose-1,6-bisphosphatase/inositol monophosphatase family enzyme
MINAHWMLRSIQTIHAEIRTRLLLAYESARPEDMARVAADGAGDTIYSIDRISEELLVELFETGIARQCPILLVAEGLPGGKIALPRGTRADKLSWLVIADPIDGTRSLMYQKRSGWILTGVAPNRGESTCLADIELAVQTELPLVKQHLCDTLWAIRGEGAEGERLNRLTGEAKPLLLCPSKAAELSHGFSSISRFFSGARDVLAAIDDEIQRATLGIGHEGKASSFEDQYLSTGGQLYELMMGHDRFLADLRPLLRPILKKRGLPLGLCCHPYDLCTELIAREAGILITDESGDRLRSSLNTELDVAWAGYANEQIRALVEPVLHTAILRHGLAPHTRKRSPLSA